MKKLSPIAYRTLFFKHLWRFLTKVASPQELSGEHAIAVSGGIDSMTLLWVASCLSQEKKIGPVRALFVHHHTRQGQDREQLLVEQFCRELGVPCKVLHAENLQKSGGNFEARARRARRELCLSEIKNHELLWQGHHLDDSFEWNFMQRFRSTSPKSTIGIPVRHTQIIRPFLCVTKAQIKRLAKFEGISYAEDPTNADLRHDRNYIRHMIVPLIRRRYPKYLKFYSYFANFSAMLLKTSVISRTGASRLFVYDEGAVLVGKYFSEVQIQELIHTYSHADRGEIITPIGGMLRAIDNGKKGPFQFSGGIEAYAGHGLLMIYRKGLKNQDESIARSLAKLSSNALHSLPPFEKVELEQAWENLLSSSDALSSLPGFLLVMESDSICKTLNTSVYDARFPEVSRVCQDRGLRFISFKKCIDVWMQKKEKLPKKLKLVPLSSLSNLFPSQE